VRVVRLTLAVILGFIAGFGVGMVLSVLMADWFDMEEEAILAWMTLVGFLLVSAVFLGAAAVFAKAEGAIDRAALGCGLCITFLLGGLALIGWVRGTSASVSIQRDGPVFLAAGLPSLVGLVIVWWIIRWAAAARRA
jgi:hypothetical protein